jgi:signal transduction histidine kinase
VIAKARSGLGTVESGNAVLRGRFGQALVVVFCLLVGAIAVGRALGAAPAITPLTLLDFPTVAAFTFTLFGGLVVPRRPSNPVGWLFLAIGFSAAVAVLGGTFARVHVMAWLAAWCPALSYGLLPLALLTFPEGRLASLPERVSAAWAITSLGVTVASAAVPTWSDPELNHRGTAVLVLSWIGFLGILVGLVLAVLIIFRRWRRADGDVRQQLRWLGLGLALVPVGLLLQMLGVPGAWILPGVSVPAAAAVAILRYRLYDIDLFLNRSLVYAVLTALVVGGYVAIVALLAAIPPIGEHWRRVVATGVIAIVFAPLRERLQRAANRLLYGDRDDPYAVISRLSRLLEQSLDLTAVLPRVVETVADALRLPYVAIEGVEGGTSRLLASHGRPLGRTESFSMTYQDLVVGQLVVHPRQANQPFTPPERRLFADLAHQAGLAVHAVALTADLRRSRERLVRSREEERRRLRRDLHDGLGPTLAGMTMQVGVARALLPNDTAKAASALSTLEEQLQTSIKEIRHLVDGLRPSALDRLGLLGAVRQQIATFTTGARASGVAIQLETSGDLDDLPAAVEVAAYRIVSESITNVIRHAQATCCHVALRLNSELVVEVTDDGRGLPRVVTGGLGLTSMRERAEELRGTFEVCRRPDGGTRVYASLPLEITSTEP